MLEKYDSIPNLIHINSDKPITESMSDSPEFQKWSDFYKSFKSCIALGSVTECVASGKVIILPSISVSKNAKENLLYPVHIAIVESNSDDYQKRTMTKGYCICFCVNGNGIVEYDGESFEIEEGNGFFVDGSKNLFIRPRESGWNYISLIFDGINAKNFYEAFKAGGSHLFRLSDCPNYEMYIFQIAKALQIPKKYNEYRISNFLNMMLTDIVIGTTKSISCTVQPSTIELINQYIQEHYAEDINLKDICDNFHISYSYLSRKFKSYAGCSPSKYIMNYRIQRAKTLLSNTNSSIEEIAEQCGFKDTSYFIQSFKSVTGTTPGRYRKNKE